MQEDFISNEFIFSYKKYRIQINEIIHITVLIAINTKLRNLQNLAIVTLLQCYKYRYVSKGIMNNKLLHFCKISSKPGLVIKQRRTDLFDIARVWFKCELKKFKSVKQNKRIKFISMSKIFLNNFINIILLV